MASERTEAVVGRLKQPSTWSGVAALLVVFGLNVEAAQAVANVGAALASVASIWLNEGYRG